MPVRGKRSALLAVAVVVTILTTPVGASTQVVVGDPFPDFSATDHTGAPFQLSSHSGKVVLLHFCTMWCGPCIASAEAEADLAADLDEQIGVGNWKLVDVLVQDQNQEATDLTDAGAWRSVTDTPALTLHSSGTSLLEDFASTLGIAQFPTYFVVAPDGTVGAVLAGFSDNQLLIDAVVEVWESAGSDVQPPVIAAKKNVIVETKLAPVQVKFASPTAVDAVDGAVFVSCLPRSGSRFPFGGSPITCDASDASGNTAHSVFSVVVRLPTTLGAVSNPGNLSKILTEVHPGQRVRVTAGGFTPRARVVLFFTTASLESIDLEQVRADGNGQIDVLLNIPIKIPAGASQISASSRDEAGEEFVRAWVLTVDKGPKK